MRLLLPGTLFAAVVLASAAQAQTTSAPATSTAKADAAASQPAADKVICRSMIATDSHFPKRECHTKAEWDQISADSRQMTMDSQRSYGPH